MKNKENKEGKKYKPELLNRRNKKINMEREGN